MKVAKEAVYRTAAGKLVAEDKITHDHGDTVLVARKGGTIPDEMLKDVKGADSFFVEHDSAEAKKLTTPSVPAQQGTDYSKVMTRGAQNGPEIHPVNLEAGSTQATTSEGLTSERKVSGVKTATKSAHKSAKK